MAIGSMGDLWSRARGFAPVAISPRLLGRYGVAAALIALLLPVFAASGSHAAPVRGKASVSNPGGYARLLLTLDKDVDFDARMAGSILIVRFKEPVDIPLEKLAETMPDYIASARRDPDGRAVRLALTQKVSVNSIAAGERLFIDLLPDSWKAAPPALPVEVVRELAERARAAERALRQQSEKAEAKKPPTVRVRTSVQPTFVRYVFELPDGARVSSVLDKKKLMLSFDTVLSFDLADARIAGSPAVSAIEQNHDDKTSSVSLTLIGDVDVHAFREEKTYVVDVGFDSAKTSPVIPQVGQSSDDKKAAAVPSGKAAPSDEVKSPPKPDNGSSKAASAPEKDTAIVAPTSERIAQQADIAIKPPAPAVKSPEPAAPVVPAPTMSAAPSSLPVAQSATQASGLPPKELASGANHATQVAVKRTAQGVELTFPFASATAAAVFNRADVLWLVFDNATALDLSAISGQGGPTFRDVVTLPLSGGQAIRIRLNRPQLMSVGGDGESWTVTVADSLASTSQALISEREMAKPDKARVVVPFENAGHVFRVVDPDAGDVLAVVTAPMPARGFIKRQSFVEFAFLNTVHGIVVQPNSEDVQVDVGPDRVVVSRPGGLTLSTAATAPERENTAVRPVLDTRVWLDDQQGRFTERLDQLVRAAAQATDDKRMETHLDLARFYLANKFYPEAVGVLNSVQAETKDAADYPPFVMLHAIASILRGRPDQGLKDLAEPAAGAGNDSDLWRAMALARQAKWAQARAKFKDVAFAIAALPIDLQRLALLDALRTAIEIRDFTTAASRLNELEIIGIPDDLKPEVSVLRGRSAEALGHERDALAAFHQVALSSDRPVATEAKLREIELLQKRGEIQPEDMLNELETLAVMWRGDALEVKTLHLLERLYADRNRYRDAFMASRLASMLEPNSTASRQMQDDASALFSQVFLGDKDVGLSPVEALAVFYEFRELTPIGRRGDEMIRKLSDRLVAVDLLDQAAELLQYQVDHRLDGAARAQIASRLATIYLMNHKPDRAIATLRSTRISDLAGELRQQRLLLEARAQSDIGRHDLAIDIVSNLTGREVIRLRSDIYWAARRWREASEQIELLYGDRWRDFKPLTSEEKADVMRAAIGYSLADDKIGMSRLREKYGPKLTDAADRTAFDIATLPAQATNDDLAGIAKMAASVDTLDGFLREMRSRFPDGASSAPSPARVADSAPSAPNASKMNPATQGAAQR